jgi:hypothetical protein
LKIRAWRKQQKSLGEIQRLLDSSDHSGLKTQGPQNGLAG